MLPFSMSGFVLLTLIPGSSVYMCSPSFLSAICHDCVHRLGPQRNHALQTSFSYSVFSMAVLLRKWESYPKFKLVLMNQRLEFYLVGRKSLHHYLPELFARPTFS